MNVSVVTGPGETQVIDAPKPVVGPADVLAKIQACGICGTDALFISMGLKTASTPGAADKVVVTFN